MWFSTSYHGMYFFMKRNTTTSLSYIYYLHILVYSRKQNSGNVKESTFFLLIEKPIDLKQIKCWTYSSVKNSLR